MKILLYNACYCIGFKEPRKSQYEKLWKYIYSGTSTLVDLIELVKQENPDVLALTEIDSGSIRARLVNQPLSIANECGFGSVFYKKKYGPALIKGAFPIFAHQCNAILAKKPDVKFDFGFFEATGDLAAKNLYLQCAIHPKIDLFVLHLPLDSPGRANQLKELARILKGRDREVIVSGDFNIFEGHSEIEYLMKECRLESVNIGRVPTYPSWKPEKEIDLILKTPGIKIKKFEVLDVHLSDHLPLIADIDIL